MCLSLFSTALLSACGGGGSHILPSTPASSQGTTPTGTSSKAGDVVVTGSFTGNGPILFASTHRRIGNSRTRNVALTFDHIEVDGTLFPGDAGAYPITNTISIPAPTNGTYTASVPFSNAPVHPNEWAVLQFVGVAKDGSKIALGDTGGIINVSATSTTSASVTAATTETLQVFLALVGLGAVSTYDLDHTTTLAANIASDITATAAKIDASTGLLDGPTLQTVYNAIAPKYERDITITASPATAKYFTIVQDYTSAEELDLLNNDAAFSDIGVYSLFINNSLGGNVTGASGCGNVVVDSLPHTPAQFPIAPNIVSACVLGSTNGTLLVRGVYGGNVIVGATNDPLSPGSESPASYVGGNLKITGEPVGAFKSTVTVAAAQHEYTVSDPAAFAFGPSASLSGGLLTESAYVPSGLLSNTTFAVSTGGAGSVPLTISPSYSATNDKIIASTFNPWDLADPYLRVCGGLSCYPLSTPTTQTLSIVRPFEDPGTNDKYFNWTPGGTLHSITASDEGGYALDFTAAGTGSMSTSKSTVFTAGEVLEFGNTFPAGSEIVVTAVDTAGKSYSNGALLGDYAEQITMSSVYQNTTMKSVTIEFYVPAAGTYNFLSLMDEGSQGAGGL